MVRSPWKQLNRTYYQCFEHYPFPWPTVTPPYHLQFADYLIETGQNREYPKSYAPGEDTDWERTICDVIKKFQCGTKLWPEEFAKDLENAKMFICELCVAGIKERDRVKRIMLRQGLFGTPETAAQN